MSIRPSLTARLDLPSRSTTRASSPPCVKGRADVFLCSIGNASKMKEEIANLDRDAIACSRPTHRSIASEQAKKRKASPITARPLTDDHSSLPSLAPLIISRQPVLNPSLQPTTAAAMSPPFRRSSSISVMPSLPPRKASIATQRRRRRRPSSTARRRRRPLHPSTRSRWRSGSFETRGGGGRKRRRKRRPAREPETPVRKSGTTARQRAHHPYSSTPSRIVNNTATSAGSSPSYWRLATTRQSSSHSSIHSSRFDTPPFPFLQQRARLLASHVVDRPASSAHGPQYVLPEPFETRNSRFSFPSLASPFVSLLALRQSGRGSPLKSSPLSSSTRPGRRPPSRAADERSCLPRRVAPAPRSGEGEGRGQ